MQAYDLSKVSILVLEKHLLIRNLLTEVFDEFGIATTMSTADPEVAYDMLATSPVPIDIVLTDWSPDLDGIAFLKRLRRDPATPNPFVPVIVCTANSEIGHICTVRDMGGTEILVKPVSARTIYSRICSVIESHRPFVRITDFFGPDRRRRGRGMYGGLERRKRSI